MSKELYSFSLMKNNWYGRKQERQLKLFADHLDRIDPLTATLRGSWRYDSLKRIQHDQRQGSVVLEFEGGTQEHYQSQLSGLPQALVDALQTLAPHVELVQVL